MGVNSLPNTVTRQRRGCDLNPGRSAPESNMLTAHYFAPGKGEEFCDERVCLYVCLSASISPELHVRSSRSFCARCMRPRLGPPLAALRYVMYFRFYG